MSNPQIDEWYELGRKNGALGGKLIGAGGGGFLMFYAEDHRRLRAAMARGRPRGGALPLRLRRHEGAVRVMPAGRDPRRRSGHAAAARHRDASRRRWSRSPAGRSPPTSSSCCAGKASTDVVFCVGHLGEQIEACARRRHRAGACGSATCSTARALLGTGGAIATRAAAARRSAFFVLYGDSYLECDFAAVAAALPAPARRAGLMTVSATTTVGTAATSSSATARIVRYDKAHARAGDAAHRLRPRRPDRSARSAPSEPDEPFDLARVYQDLLRRPASWPASRCPSASTKSARPRGSATRESLPSDESGHDDDATPRSTWTKPPAIIAADSIATRSSAWRDVLAGVRGARRPPVLPRRRRQRRQLRRTPSTTSARSPASRPTRRPTTSRS